MRISRLILACIPALLLVLVACSSVEYGAIPDRGPAAVTDTDAQSSVDFAANAFPPILPADAIHGYGPVNSWHGTACLNCHENGKNNAPKAVHEGMSDSLLLSKCRTCHTSVEE
ncbi:MAG: hypothetical protein H8E15_17260 [Planctomycetes bacterium]|nr:hypothetical protein [Planctomycetota bacterium]